MGRLKAQYSPAFIHDAKRLRKKHIDDAPLAEVIDLIIENSPASLEELRRRHRMHELSGGWAGSRECHIANAGDWLLIWTSDDEIALLERTGTHDELFR
ncbi:MAG: type II toxin-antitoxin system YafQ family toxin [Atopobiaceae bacterium]